MNVNLIRDIKDLVALRQEWQYLLDRCRPNYIFMTWQWLLTWWKHFGQNRELFVLVVRERSELVGVVPLALFTNGDDKTVSVRCLNFMGYKPGKRFTDYMDIIAVRKDEVIEATFEYLQTCKHLWDVIDLWDILEDSDSIEILEKAAKRIGFDCSKDKVDKAVYLLTDSRWELFYEEKTKRRNEFERLIRRLKEKGDLRTLHADKSDATGLIDFLFEMYGQRWKYITSESLLLYRNFCRDLLSMVPQDWRKCSYLMLDEKPIAAQISLQYRSKLYYLMTAYDSSFMHFSPGRIQLKNLIEECFLEGEITEFYYGRGDEHYKYEWASGELGVYRLQVSERINANRSIGTLKNSSNNRPSLKQFGLGSINERKSS